MKFDDLIDDGSEPYNLEFEHVLKFVIGLVLAVLAFVLVAM